MGEDVKNYVLDTSVIINDPYCIYSFEDNNLILHQEVIRELQKLSKGEDVRNQRAREALREIHRLGKKIEKGRLYSDLPLGGKLIFHSPGIEDLSELPKAESKILKFMAKDKKNYDDNLTLVTDNISLFLLAQINLIEVEHYQNQTERSRPEKDLNILENLVKIKTRINLNQDLVDIISSQDEVKLEGKFEKLREIFHHGQFLYSTKDNLNLQFLIKKKRPYLKKVNWQYFGANGNKKQGDQPKLDDITEFNFPEPYNDLFGVIPKNYQQEQLAKILLDDNIKIATAIGYAGTGKSYLALASALSMVVEQKRYKSIRVIRPALGLGEKLNYQKETEEEAIKPFLKPVYETVQKLYKNKHGNTNSSPLDVLISRGMMEIDTGTYIKGESINDCLIIIDEAQEYSRRDLKIMITRLEGNSKIILVGDPFQINNPNLNEETCGLIGLTKSLLGEEYFSTVLLSIGERSEAAGYATKYL
ncbi:AAA family ATPase [archaeon]|jgi:PhoH-like ATPase|nr:AAA family ATPase [archaeon]MBT3451398.1 AAA family ATPase [archaeon]MBT6869007.1 AAA family ATPase [archaeon]MBT7193273.1 AAA family ATPase [archaeon]MBT7380128.1 AAA family ATPase [archaeon]